MCKRQFLPTLAIGALKKQYAQALIRLYVMASQIRIESLKEGDILNIDVTVIKDGWHGDTSKMYLVGKVPAP